MVDLVKISTENGTHQLLLLREIHSSKNSSVYSALYGSDLIVCVKIDHTAGKSYNQIENENRILNMMQDIDVVPKLLLYGNINGEKAIVTWPLGVPLSQCMNELTEDNVIPFCNALGECLRVIHSKGIVHGDIKPENIILTKTGIIFIDFGSAYMKDSEEHPNFITIYIYEYAPRLFRLYNIYNGYISDKEVLDLVCSALQILRKLQTQGNETKSEEQ